ncbi:MAG: VOC family protein [Gemmatimonadota bacterium]|nr:MAG: VOC family protein [Gemmatimonadota bacterium]
MASTATIVTLGVRDLKRSIRFYETGIGLQRVPYEPETIAFFDLGGAQLALFPRNELAEDAGVSGIGEGFRGVSLARFLGSSQEVDAFLERAVQAGGTLTRKARPQPWGGYSGYFGDLDGHLWEIGCDSKTYATERAAAQEGAAAAEPQRD